MASLNYLKMINLLVLFEILKTIKKNSMCLKDQNNSSL